MTSWLILDFHLGLIFFILTVKLCLLLVNCNPCLCLWYYDFDKEINANVYRHSLWEYYKRFHCSFEWHLTPHMTLLQHSPRVSAWYRFHCSLNFYHGDYSGIESANEIHVRHKEITINDALTFIPGETQDNPLTIAIDLPKFCRIPKAGHITDCNKAASTGVEYDVQRCITPQLSFLLFRFVAFHYDMKLIYCGILFLRRF